MVVRGNVKLSSDLKIDAFLHKKKPLLLLKLTLLPIHLSTTDPSPTEYENSTAFQTRHDGLWKSSKPSTRISRHETRNVTFLQTRPISQSDCATMHLANLGGRHRAYSGLPSTPLYLLRSCERQAIFIKCLPKPLRTNFTSSSLTRWSYRGPSLAFRSPPRCTGRWWSPVAPLSGREPTQSAARVGQDMPPRSGTRAVAAWWNSVLT